MAISLHVALNASVVIVGVDLSSMDDFVDELQAITKTDVQVLSGEAEDPDVLILDRERIEIAIQESQFLISREYPSEQDLPALASISIATLDFHSKSIEAIGYNVELVFDQDSGRSAERYLGERLFTHKELGSEAWPLWGGSGRMVFGHSQERKSFTIAPRLDDERTTRVHVTANFHVENGRVPSEVAISESLATIWKDSHRVMELIDQGAAL